MRRKTSASPITAKKIAIPSGPVFFLVTGLPTKRYLDEKNGGKGPTRPPFHVVITIRSILIVVAPAGKNRYQTAGRRCRLSGDSCLIAPVSAPILRAVRAGGDKCRVGPNEGGRVTPYPPTPFVDVYFLIDRFDGWLRTSRSENVANPYGDHDRGREGARGVLHRKTFFSSHHTT